VRAARAADGTIVVYLPMATRVVLDAPLEHAQVTVLDLAQGRVGRLVPTVADGRMTVPVHRFDEDVLLLVSPR
jgi:hypothetical protein